MHLHYRLPHRQRAAPLALAAETKQHLQGQRAAVTFSWVCGDSTQQCSQHVVVIVQQVELRVSVAAWPPHRNLAALVIPTEQVDLGWVAQLEGQQRGHNLKAHGPCKVPGKATWSVSTVAPSHT
jgi:hypothetical protein